MTFFRGLSFLAIFFYSTLSLAGYFQSLRFDQNIPYHCAEPETEDFLNEFETATFSIRNATEHGFSFEVSIDRDDARKLWKYFKNHAEGQAIPQSLKDYVNAHPELRYFKEMVLANYSNMGFNFHSEGEILEILVLMELQNTYSPDEYYFTGGIEYSRGTGPVLGELDIIVARRDDCKAVLIGESKLGIHRLSKAKKQIRRFVNFVDTIRKHSLKLNFKSKQGSLDPLR